ncbi:MAG: hypothetical protein QQN41_09950, partial [Nitrosopumilus sp.]
PKHSGRICSLPETILKLKADEQIKSVYQHKDTIKIQTESIICGHSNLGEYDITIDTEKKYYKITRIKGRINRYHHPFFTGGGEHHSIGCFGNQEAVMSRAWSHKDWYGVTLLILELLQCSSPEKGGRAHCSISNFKKKAREQNKIEVASNEVEADEETINAIPATTTSTTSLT